MRADLISAAFTTLHFGKYSFIVHNCFSLLDPHANSHISKDFININQQNLSAGSCKSNKRRKINSLAQSYIKSSQTREQDRGLGSPAVSPSGSRATARILLAPDNPASIAPLGTRRSHQGTAPAPWDRGCLPVKNGAFPCAFYPATGLFLFSTAAAGSRVTDGSFPLPSSSLNHSDGYTEDFENPYALRVSDYKALMRFIAPERGENGNTATAGQLPRFARSRGERGASEISRNSGKAATRHRTWTAIHTGSNPGGKSRLFHHMGF